MTLKKRKISTHKEESWLFWPSFLMNLIDRLTYVDEDFFHYLAQVDHLLYQVHFSYGHLPLCVGNDLGEKPYSDISQVLSDLDDAIIIKSLASGVFVCRSERNSAVFFVVKIKIEVLVWISLSHIFLRHFSSSSFMLLLAHLLLHCSEST